MSKKDEYEQLIRRQELQRVVLVNRRPRTTNLERALWRIAGESPFGGQIIPASGVNPYLLRTYLTRQGQRFFIPWGELRGLGARPYLHFFYRGDADREYHNHPWTVSYSWILTGGYEEERWDEENKRIVTRVFRPGSFNIIRRDDFHKVRLLQPNLGCWTLFLSVGRVRESDGKDWGFLDIETGKYTPWGEYQKAGTLPPDVSTN